jgi:hypothetical protein
MARDPAPTTLIPAAAGSALAAGAVTAVLVGVAPPVAIAAGVIAVVAGAATTLGLRRDVPPPRLVLPPAPTSDELLAAVNQVEAQIQGKVPPAGRKGGG